MSVLVVGVSHRSAPVSLLEKVTVGISGSEGLVAELQHRVDNHPDEQDREHP